MLPGLTSPGGEQEEGAEAWTLGFQEVPDCSPIWPADTPTVPVDTAALCGAHWVPGTTLALLKPHLPYSLQQL